MALVGSGAALLLQQGLSHPLQLPYCVAVQAAVTALSLSRAGAMCAAPAMRHPCAAGAARGAFTALGWLLAPSLALSMSYGGGFSRGGAASSSTPAAASEAAEAGSSPECWAVVAFAQLCCGFLLPVVLHAARECAAHESFCRQHRSRVAPEWAAWLYRRATAAPAVGGWERALQLAAASYSLLSGVWLVLEALANQPAPSRS